MTQIIKRVMTSNPEQPSIETSLSLSAVDTVADKDARNYTIKTIRTTETVLSDAVYVESGPASPLHLFKDAAYCVLPSPLVVSRDER